MKVAVIGAGVSGLGAAMNLAHAGHDVVVIERDATPLPHSPDEAFEWNRRGAPQVRHSHAFLARGRNLIRDRLPDVRTALLEAGVTEVSWTEMAKIEFPDAPSEPGDEDLTMLACRRTTFEWVMRRCALETDRVEIRDGTVANGLVAQSGNGGNGPVRITGVKTGDDTIEADIFVDSTGRPSHMNDLLAGVGVHLTETKSQTGIVYLSRFYRLNDGVEPPDENTFNGADLEYLKYAIFRGDNRTFSITLAFAPEDEQLQALREEARFEAVTSQIEAIAKWTNADVSTPIGPVAYMGGLINRVRHFVVDGEPIALGLFGVGDASVCTNPLFGRGCSLGLVHGALLTDAIDDLGGDDMRALALRFDDDTTRELIPWYDASVGADKTAMKVQRGEELNQFEAFLRSLIREGVFPASRIYPDVSRVWFRSFNLLDTPDSLMTNVEVMRKVMEVYEDRENRPPEPPAGPTREELFAAIGG